MTLITDNLTVLVSPSGDNVETQQLASQDKRGVFKKCSVCCEILEITNFFRNKNTKDGYQYNCKKCSREISRLTRERIKNSAKITPETKLCSICGETKHSDCFHRKSNVKSGLRSECKDCSLNYHKQQENKERRNKKLKHKRDTDSNFKFACVIRSQIHNALENCGIIKSETTENLIGITLEKCKEYLELQFLPGMTWENNTRNGWHIDHIIPCASFDLSDLEQQKKCFHYTNLTPRWATTAIAKAHGSNQIGNIEKGNKILS